MLVLSRKKDEKIIIGDNITLTVVEIRGDKVRLGIDAPKEVPIHRQEIYDAIQKQAAAERKKNEEDMKEGKLEKDVETTNSSGSSEDPNDPNYSLQSYGLGNYLLDYRPRLERMGFGGLARSLTRELKQYNVL